MNSIKIFVAPCSMVLNYTTNSTSLTIEQMRKSFISSAIDKE
ncbi:hypothetical protein [Flavobacterium hiemivividum]|nr:hypothetical protein [Flavobacterium hiemivividum]